MNKDQVQGHINEAKGAVKEIAGKLVGNEDLEQEGTLQKTAGKVESAYGGSFSSTLMQVSTDFAEVIAQIKRSLEILGKERLIKD